MRKLKFFLTMLVITSVLLNASPYQSEGKYADIKEMLTKQEKLLGDYIKTCENAKDAKDIVAAINNFKEGLIEQNPDTIAIEKKYGNLKELFLNPPEELKTPVEKVKELSQKMKDVVVILSKYKRDPGVMNAYLLFTKALKELKETRKPKTEVKNVSQPGGRTIENQFRMNGFWLLQYKMAIPKTLGKPFHTEETDYFTREVYRFSEKAYMVFGFLKEKPNLIYSIQIAGEDTEMIPFVGLKLGDDKSKVIKILGKPDEIQRVESVKVDLYLYTYKNYSVEINDSGKLCSIMITCYKELLSESPMDTLYWVDFKKAVLNKDFKRLADLFRPDVEIYKNDETLYIDKAFHSFVSEPPGKFYDAFFSESDSVYKELQNSEPKRELRIAQQVGVGYVFKFYQGKILEEIVFFPYAGKFRVYEIRFRK